MADPGEGPGVPTPSPLFVDQTEARGARSPPLFVDQSEARRAEKGFYLTSPPHLPLSLDDNGIFRRSFADGHNQSLLLSAA